MKRITKAAAAIVLIALLLAGSTIAAAAAQPPAGLKQSQVDFITRIGPLAAADMKKNGVCASLTIAQAILESSWGTSELARNGKALFGIRADSNWKGKTYTVSTGQSSAGARYRAYGSWEASLDDHSVFLRENKRYAAVIGRKNFRIACWAIQGAGYATAPNYATELIQLIKTYKLSVFDNGGTAADWLDALSRQSSCIEDWLRSLCR